MKKILAILIAVLALTQATSAGNLKRYFQDAAFPTQRLVEKQTFTNPAAAGTADVLSENAGNTSAAAASVSTFVAQPDLPRNLVVTPGGTTADVAACDVTITGKNIYGSTISENYTFAANQTTAVTGSKAFRTVTSVSFPAACEDSPYGASWSVGYGEKIGLKNCLDNAGDIVKSLLNGAKEATEPTMAADNDEVEKNTADFNGTMNGSNDFVLYFMQNNRCPQ